MVRAFMRAAQQAAEQGVGPQHHLETHDFFLARRHAERAPRDTRAKLTSSLDFPADSDSDHQVGAECDTHTSADDTSHACDSDAPSAPCASPKPDLPSTHQHRTHGDVTG
ncbi:hypothetical protein T484DRAFT_1915985 [Baffinella frigidus]|nr:hypothetical protein T484DRAFT_1915985 [Cryptophyta sp. CCMP2293]